MKCRISRGAAAVDTAPGASVGIARVKKCRLHVAMWSYETRYYYNRDCMSIVVLVRVR